MERGEENKERLDGLCFLASDDGILIATSFSSVILAKARQNTLYFCACFHSSNSGSKFCWRVAIKRSGQLVWHFCRQTCLCLRANLSVGRSNLVKRTKMCWHVLTSQ